MIPRRYLVAIVILLTAVLTMGFYALHLKWSAERTAAAPLIETTPAPVPTPAGPMQRITLFVPYDGEGVLRKQEAEVALPEEPGARAREVLHALIRACQQQGSAHPLAQNGDVRNVFLVNEGLAVVDVNAALADNHPSGIMVEELTVAAMAQTLAANVSGVTRIKLLVNGKERATLAGHADLSAIYESATFNNWVRE